MNRFWRTSLLATLTALAGMALFLTPWGPAAEEEFGLDLLFRWRGKIAAPAEVVIVALDKRSAAQFNLPNEPRKWPRALHADLIDRLARGGATVIGFDIMFEEARDGAQDAKLARAIARAGNVVLFETLRKSLHEAAPGNTPPVAVSEQIVQPLPVLTEAAAATAPFPLPRVPVKLSQAWAFKAGAGERATLPVVMFQLARRGAYAPWRELMQRVDTDAARALPATAEALTHPHAVHDFIQALRAPFRRDTSLGKRLLDRLQTETTDASQTQTLRSLIHLYAGDDSRYLNFYGGPRSVTTVNYHAALTDRTLNWRGKWVLVGFSERLQPEQKDHFYTAFTRQDSGLDLSGVEIAATALANLVQDNSVNALSLGAQLAVVLFAGVLFAVPAIGLRAPVSLVAVAALGAGYAAWAAWRFASAAEWVPLVVPLLIQAPGALFGGVLWNYFEVNRERERIRAAFGRYLPKPVVDDLAGRLTHEHAGGNVVHGACLATDAARYTTLAETMAPEELNAFVNRYYSALFAPVREHGGMISDVVGDSMLALWAQAQPNASLRERACHAAVAVAQAAERFSRDNGRAGLTTRLGLHAGPMYLGHVGAHDHFEYRAVGDIVNTAARLQALNKTLGTRLLASQEAVDGLPRLRTRDLGRFLLPGKTQPVHVHELRGIAGEPAAAAAWLADFEHGLKHFHGARWSEAVACFKKVQAATQDGPARFYLAHAEALRLDPPPAWDGVVRIQNTAV
jgi:adenylate cyclase